MWGVIIYLVVFWGGIWLIGTIVDAVQKKRAELRDQATKEVFGSLNIESVIENYKKKLEHIKYREPNTIQDSVQAILKQIYGRDAILMEKCPKCKYGDLVIRKGKYGKFLGCTKYPKCNYTINIEKARENSKKSINEQIIDAMRIAYTLK